MRGLVAKKLRVSIANRLKTGRRHLEGAAMSAGCELFVEVGVNWRQKIAPSAEQQAVWSLKTSCVDSLLLLARARKPFLAELKAPE